MKTAQAYKALRWIFVIILSNCIVHPILAEDIELTRTEKLAFPIQASHELEIRNRYGTIDIQNWDKNSVEVSITIVARASKADKAQKRLDGVYIRDRQYSKKLQLVSEFESLPIIRIGQPSVEVHYRIRMPASNPLDLENKHGDVIVGNRTGSIDIDLSYGNFQADQLAADDNHIRINGGDIDIVSVNGIDIDGSFGKLFIGTADFILFKGKSFKTEIDEVKTLEVYANMCKMDIEEAGSVSGTYSSANFSLKRLKSHISLTLKYVKSFKIETLLPGFVGLDLHSRYSFIDLNFAPSTGVDIEAVMYFGVLRINGEEPQFEDIEVVGEKATGRLYDFALGKGTKGKIRMESKFGNIRLGSR